MWDPRSYRDTDFGLAEAESFEPGDADAVDEARCDEPHIMTVLGAIEPDQLGVCQVAEHIFAMSTDGIGSGSLQRLRRLDFASAEVEAYFTAGGRSMVDITTPDIGRDVAGLKEIAQRVPVHLIASVGRHHYHDDEDLLAEEFLNEISRGIGETGIHPGLLVAGTRELPLSTNERGLLDAASTVNIATGYPLSIRASTGPVALRALEHVLELGVHPHQVIVGGIDHTAHIDLPGRIIRLGAWLSFDQVGDESIVSDVTRAESLVRLAEDGFAGQLLISQNLNQSRDVSSGRGGPVWTHILERFTLTLMEAGAGAGLVRTVLVENPAAALTIVPPARPGVT